FGEGFWCFGWTARERKAAAASAPFGAAAAFAAKTLRRAMGLADPPEPVLLTLVARYAYSNAKLAAGCSDGGPDLRALGDGLDAAQSALRSRAKVAKEMVLAVAGEMATLDSVPLPSLCPQLSAPSALRVTGKS
ncbi:unnamed protein product, partial [Effrenium voratum]